jgi:hypothetical protein
MPIIQCPDCHKDLSDAAPACPHCGRPQGNLQQSSAESSQPQNTEKVEKRSVGVLLAIGILLVPLIFAWFTLRKGHTTRSRVISFAYLLLSLVLYGMGDSPPSTANTAPSSANSSGSSSTPTASEDRAPVYRIAVRDILSAYKSNEVAADNKYKGQWVRVSGQVGDIKKDFTNNLYVTIGTSRDFEIPKMQAFFDDEKNDQLAKLQSGSQITVTCRIKGLMMNVLGEDCVINP